MAVLVSLDVGIALSLSSSTACVLSNAGLALHVGAFEYADVSGGTFSFFFAGKPTIAVALTTVSLSSAAVGAHVLVDDGSGRWRRGSVTADGAHALSPSGTVLAPTTRAAALQTANFQPQPSSSTVCALIGSASDGTTAFTSSIGDFFGGTLSTIAGLAGSGPCLVEVASGTWQTLTL